MRLFCDTRVRTMYVFLNHTQQPCIIGCTELSPYNPYLYIERRESICYTRQILQIVVQSFLFLPCFLFRCLKLEPKLFVFGQCQLFFRVYLNETIRIYELYNNVLMEINIIPLSAICFMKIISNIVHHLRRQKEKIISSKIFFNISTFKVLLF